MQRAWPAASNENAQIIWTSNKDRPSTKRSSEDRADHATVCITLNASSRNPPFRRSVRRFERENVSLRLQFSNRYRFPRFFATLYFVLVFYYCCIYCVYISAAWLWYVYALSSSLRSLRRAVCPHCAAASAESGRFSWSQDTCPKERPGKSDKIYFEV